MKTIQYNGNSESLKRLDKLLQSTSALGESFIYEIFVIVHNTYFLDKVGMKEDCEEKLNNFYETYTKRIKLFSTEFINEIYTLIEKGIRESEKDLKNKDYGMD
jgi:hypothetical protein